MRHKTSQDHSRSLWFWDLWLHYEFRLLEAGVQHIPGSLSKVHILERGDEGCSGCVCFSCRREKNLQPRQVVGCLLLAKAPGQATCSLSNFSYLFLSTPFVPTSTIAGIIGDGYTMLHWLCHFQEMPLYQKNPRGCGPGKSKCIETRDLGVCLGTWFSGIALASAFYWFLLASWFCGPMFAILHASHLVPD